MFGVCWVFIIKTEHSHTFKRYTHLCVQLRRKFMRFRTIHLVVLPNLFFRRLSRTFSNVTGPYGMITKNQLQRHHIHRIGHGTRCAYKMSETWSYFLAAIIVSQTKVAYSTATQSSTATKIRRPVKLHTKKLFLK